MRMKDKIKISPSRLEERIFVTEQELNTYLASPKAKAGQNITLLDSTSGKYKTYTIQGTQGHYEKTSTGAGCVIGDTLADLPVEGDADMDYYVGNSTDGYVHYRYINNSYKVVGGDSFSKTETYNRQAIDAMLENLSEEINNNKGYYYTFTYGTAEIEGVETQNVFQLWKYDSEEDVGIEGKGEIIASQVITGGSGGGGGSSTSNMKITRVTPSPFIASPADNVIITLNYTSTDSSGDVGGSYEIKKDGKKVMSGDITQQGDISFDLTKYATVGTSKFQFTISDENGASQTITYTVRIMDVRIETDFDDSNYVRFGNDIDFIYTPYGNLEKTIHFKLDNTETTEVITTTGVPQVHSISAQTHGSHLLEVWATAVVNNSTIESEHIYKDIIWYNEDSSVPIIGSNFRYESNYGRGVVNMTQYDTLAIPYNVYDPQSTLPVVTLSVDGVEVSTNQLESAKNVWNYRGTTAGVHTLGIACGNRASIEIKVNVIELQLDVDPVKTGLKFDFNPEGLTNTSSNRVWTDGTYSMTPSANFDWNHGGYQVDENGHTYFCVKAGTRVTFDYYMFPSIQNDSPSAIGAEMKVIFKTENVQNPNAVWLSNVETSTAQIIDSETGNPQTITINKGVQMSVHEGWLKTNTAKNEDTVGDDSSEIYSTNTYLYMPYSEEDKIEIDISVEPIGNNENAFVMSYEDGVPAKAFVYDSGSNFYQVTPQPLVIGSDYCDIRIYRIKFYQKYLSSEEVLRNFIADSPDSTTMIDRYRRNSIYYNERSEAYTPYSTAGILTPERLAQQCPNLKVLKLSCPQFTKNKKDFVKGSSLQCIHVNGDPVLDNWLFENGYHSGQGTTSDSYGGAGRNLDFIFNADGVHNCVDVSKKNNYTLDPQYISKLTLGYDGETGTEVHYTQDGHNINDEARVSLTRTSVPNNFFNFKVNIASSENANNALLQKRYNDYLPYQTLAKLNNSAYSKNDMEFVPAVLFVKEYAVDGNNNPVGHQEFSDTEWHFYAIGNLGDSKKTDYTRAYDPNDMNEFTIEISDNTENNSTFQTGVYLENGNRVIESVSDKGIHEYIYPITAAEWNANNKRYYTLYNEAFDGDHSFEPRYACCGDYRDGKFVNSTHGQGETTEEKLASDTAQLALNESVWRAFYRWVITSTDEQFISELEQWVVKSAATYWYAFTHYFTMMDNRAKNTFWHFAKTGTYRAVSRPVAELLHIYCEKNGDVYTPTTDTSIVNGKTYHTQYAFDWWDYDNDTAIGINNNGELIFPYGKEDNDYQIDGDSGSGYVFNGATSVFWCRLRDLASAEIDNTFTNVSTNCWNYNNIINEFDAYQNCYPEALWRLDVYRKYVRPFTNEVLDNSIPKVDEKGQPVYQRSYLRDMMQGRKKYHRRQWIKDQFYYFGTKHMSAEMQQDQNFVLFRCNTPVGNNIVVAPNYDLIVYPYSDMYLTVTYGDDTTSIKAKSNQYHVVGSNLKELKSAKFLGHYYELINGEYVLTQDTSIDNSKTYYSQGYAFESPVDSATDLEVHIYGASRIKQVGGLASCYIRKNEFGTATKLKKLIIGDSTEGYRNPFLVELKLGSNPVLEELDIRGCSSLSGNLNLSNYVGLKTLYANGTALTGVIFANGGKIQDVILPNTINTLTMRNLYDLVAANFVCDTTHLSSLTIQGGNLDNFDIVENTISTLEQLYFYDATGTFDNTTLIDQIYDLPIASVLTGVLNFTSGIRQSEYTKFKTKWGDPLTINGVIIPQCSLTFLNENGTPIKDSNNRNYVQWVDSGQRSTEPINAGYISAPTKASTDKYDYTFAYWAKYTNGEIASTQYNFDSVVTTDVTLIAVFTRSLRRFTVRWMTSPVNTAMVGGTWNSELGANKSVIHQETNVEYGSEVSFDNFTKLKCTETDGDIKFIEVYNFKAWNKSTGYVTSDIDVYAIWDYVKIQKDANDELMLFDSITSERKNLKDMSMAEIAAVCANGEATTFFDDKDYFDFVMGHDYTFSNVNEETIVPLGEEIHLDGITPVIPTDSNGNQIKLFAADSPSFTMAIDYQFTNDVNDYAPADKKTLVSCFENPDNGNDGFALRYNSNKANILWGDKNSNVATSFNRDMVILRHIQGSDILYVYAFNGGALDANYYSNDIVTATLTRTAFSNSNAPLVFGGIAEYDSENQRYSATSNSTYIGSGIIYWCKIWYADLGDTVARQLASWTRDDDRQEYFEVQLDSAGTLFGSPYVLSGSSTKANASFISNNLMRYFHQMNNQNVNSGGWGGNQATGEYQKSMHYFMQNKFYPAIPNEIRNLIAQVKAPSSVGNKSTTVANYDSYIYIPCYREVVDSNETKGNPYAQEGSFISWNTTQQRRICFRDVITTDTSLLANGNAKFTGSSEPIFGQNKGFYDADTNVNGVREYDIWFVDNNTAAMIYLSAQTIRKRNLTPVVWITQGTERIGGWVGANSYFLRSPLTGNPSSFWFVYYYGVTSNYNGANYWSGVRPCFSFFANVTE